MTETMYTAVLYSRATKTQKHVHSSVQLCLHKAAHTHTHTLTGMQTHTPSGAKAQTLERAVSQQGDCRESLENDPSAISPQREGGTDRAGYNAVQTVLLADVDRLT